MMLLLIFKNYCLFSVCHHSSEVARSAHMSIFRFATGLIIIIYLIKNHSTQSIKTKIEHLFLVHLHAHLRMFAKFFMCKACTSNISPSTWIQIQKREQQLSHQNVSFHESYSWQGMTSASSKSFYAYISFFQADAYLIFDIKMLSPN